jgi:Prealbumin-like fold domain
MLKALFFTLLLLAPRADACSMASCLDRGIEVGRDFVVVAKHEGKPLQGVTIEIKVNGGSTEFRGVTDFKGKMTITSLPPGEYWLNAELLGIGAAYHCFHVNRQSSRKAKRLMKYDWGTFAPSMARVAGRLIDMQPGTGGTPLWNMTHRVTIPIAGADLRLQNAITGGSLTATSDDRGEFGFDTVSNGTYVLHIEGGTTGRVYDPTDLLIKVSSTAVRTAVTLTRHDPGATNCGDTSLFPSWK